MPFLPSLRLYICLRILLAAMEGATDSDAHAQSQWCLDPLHEFDQMGEAFELVSEPVSLPANSHYPGNDPDMSILSLLTYCRKQRLPRSNRRLIQSRMVASLRMPSTHRYTPILHRTQHTTTDHSRILHHLSRRMNRSSHAIHRRRDIQISCGRSVAGR